MEDLWSFFFHDPNDTDWTHKSYVHICDVTDLEEFEAITDYMSSNLQKGMFFLFREGIFPCWDDPENINGGSFSFKIIKSEVASFWKDVTKKMLTESLNLREQDEVNITGLSISPKNKFCIIKVWVNKDVDGEWMFDMDRAKYKGEVLYKSHRSCMMSS